MSQNPEMPIRADEGWSRAEIDAAIAGLDRATRIFSRQVGALGADAGSPGRAPREASPAAPRPGDRAGTERPPQPHEPLYDRPGAAAETETDGRRTPTGIDPETAFEARMREAQQEAEEYLERAKRRADSLVNTMIGAVEREAAGIREEAERGIRERWRQVEAEASRFLGDARRVADNMVAERQQTISELSDGIAGRAHALTRGMDDAERVRRQFEGFVRTLSETADQIAEQSSGSVQAEITRLTRAQRPRRGAHARATAA